MGKGKLLLDCRGRRNSVSSCSSRAATNLTLISRMSRSNTMIMPSQKRSVFTRNWVSREQFGEAASSSADRQKQSEANRLSTALSMLSEYRRKHSQPAMNKAQQQKAQEYSQTMMFVVPSSSFPSDRDNSSTLMYLPCSSQSDILSASHPNMPIVSSQMDFIGSPSAVLSPASSLFSKSSSNSFEHSSYREGIQEDKMKEGKQRKIGVAADAVVPPYLRRNFACATPNANSITAVVPAQQNNDVDSGGAQHQQRNQTLFHLDGTVPKAESDENEWAVSTTPSATAAAEETKHCSSSVSLPSVVGLQNAQISANSNETKRHRWFDSGEAKNSVMCGLSLFYSMLVSIFALVLELSHLMVTNNSRRNLGYSDMLFGIYMYGCSVLFLLYCYCALLLNPRWKRKFGKFLRKNAESSVNIVLKCNSELQPQQQSRKVSHDGPSAGSLFLRLGCVVFGVIGTVYYAFNVFLCISDGTCPHYAIVLDIMAIVFVFVQMHFVFCNWKLAISGHQIICRFGTAHLIATNLWTWIRYILIEESLMGDEIRQVFARHAAFPAQHMAQSPLVQLSKSADGGISSSSSREFVNWDAPSMANAEPPRGANVDISFPGTGLLLGAGLTATAKRSVGKCHGAECVLASFNEVMYTSIVEYSLIGAAVMFIVWKNIGQCQLLNEHKTPLKGYVRRKHRIRMDCSKSTTGLFVGLAFLAGTFTSMSIFSGYTIMGQHRQAMMVFGLTDIIHYLIATIGCGVALWRMRLLRYHTHQQQQQKVAKPTSVLTDYHELMIGTHFGTKHPHYEPHRQQSNDQHQQQRQQQQQKQQQVVGTNLYGTNNEQRRDSGSGRTAITFVGDDTTTNEAEKRSTFCASSCSAAATAAGKGNESNQKSQELLDMILLAFGMTGEMIYSVAGLLGHTGSVRAEEQNWEQMTLILLTVHVTRIFQVGLQSCLIYIAGKLRIGNDPMLREWQPGKQAITFLLLANISMFLMNLLEAEKAGVSDTVVNFYGKRNWVFLVRSFSPLTIFYRFHSSVCLAEIWKSTYSWKE